jgi:phage terminase small subunit
MYLGAVEDIRTHGRIINTGQRLFINPAANIINEQQKFICRLSKELGIANPVEQDKWQGLLDEK